MEKFKNLFDKYSVLKSDNLDVLCTALYKHAESEEIKQIRAIIQKEMAEKLKEFDIKFITAKAPKNREEKNYNVCDNPPRQADSVYAIMPGKSEHTYYHVIKNRDNRQACLKPLLFANQTYVELTVGEEVWRDLSFQELQKTHPSWKDKFPVFCFFKIVEFCGNFVRCKVIESTNDCFPTNGGYFTLHKEYLHSSSVKLVNV